MSTVVKTLRFLAAQWQVNLASAMAYRVSFLSQTIFMILNDILLLFFWWVLLQNVPDIGGWGMGEIWLMYGLSAGGYGLVALLAINSFRLSTIIAEGQLDYYLALPKNVLLHVLVSQTDFAAVGDLGFGLVVGALGCQALGTNYGLFLVLMINAAAILCAFGILVHSLAFFIGRSESLSQLLTNSLMTFSMYPGTIYQGATRLIVFLLIPAGFVTHLPVATLTSFNWNNLVKLALATTAFWLVAVAVFKRGLARYESGNQMVMRG